jgi:allantoinase
MVARMPSGAQGFKVDRILSTGWAHGSALAAFPTHPLPRPRPMLYDATLPYPRDLVGYGPNVPHAQWPGGARVAVQFVLNYEEGGENHVLHGDAGSEQFLSEMFNPASYPERHMSMDGIYEYGSRVGVWRLLREFKARGLPLTVFGIASALARHPQLVDAMQADGHEIACHGLKWIHYQSVPEAVEREHMAQAMETLTRLMGQRPLGWYTGRDSPNTHRLVADYGGFAYDADYYGEDLPFWMQLHKTDGSVAQQLVVPYTLDCNDMRFALPQGYSHAEPFFAYLRDTFDCLYAEGDPNGLNRPKMMSVGMHCRLLGRPGRMVALQRFLDHLQRHTDVWVATRLDIAKHWAAVHPAPPAKAQA